MLLFCSLQETEFLVGALWCSKKRSLKTSAVRIGCSVNLVMKKKVNLVMKKS